MAPKKNAEEIFGTAVGFSDPAEQAAYLEEACRGDEKLRAEVEALLQWHKEAGSFLDAPALGEDVTLGNPAPLEGPGTVIGRYKLLEQIGEGGMATVYLAQQEAPVCRKVALKIIKLGMDSRSVVARFEAERQALALMDHPNIAKVFDAGLTDAGRPYFVMELVRGIAITEYCDKNKLGTADRLELFIQVCHAVQHAHQKGIIHRDIKPSNIMVTLHNGRPQAVVIDFGIAKATSQRLTEKTLFTRYAQLIGTPEYMSPEQAEMSRLDVDTRTDIYSLGVLLYELLTGSTPFGGEQLRRGGYAEIQRIIRETEPQKPSTKLSTLGKTLTEVAQQRRTTAEALSKLVRGDLDWIVMKTLEKDRTRRYETAHALVQDIERHLNNEPISAGPPRTLDRCRKFVRRNRALVAGAAAVGLVLLVGIAVSTWFALGQSRALKEARQQSERYRAIATFLQKDVFGTLDPWRDGGREVLIEELLDTATKRAQGSFGDQPLVEASIRATLGATYQRLGKYAEAEPHLLRAVELHSRLLGDRDPATLAVKLELGALYFFAAREPEAEPIYAEVLSDSRRVLGPRHETTISAMLALACVYMHAHSFDKAEELTGEAWQTAQDILGPDHDTTVKCMLVLGTTYSGLGRLDEAERLLTAGLEKARRVWGPRHPDTVHLRCNLALVHANQGLVDKAQEEAQAALDTARASFAAAHGTTLTAMGTRAWIYSAQKEYDQAESLLLETREICKRQKPDGRYWVPPESDLAWFYRLRQRYAEAQPYARQALEQIQAKWGTRGDWPRCAWILADIELRLGRYEEAQKVFAQLREALLERRGEIDTYLAPILNNIAWLRATHERAELRNGKEAVQWATKACELTRWENRPYIGTLAAACAQAGDFETALNWYRKAVEVTDNTWSQVAQREYEWRLANILFRSRRYDEGQQVFAGLLQALRAGGPEIDPRLAWTLNNIAWLRATHERAELRNGKEAVQWATKACELTGWKNEAYLDTLAAACAESGDFKTAVEWQEKVIELLRQRNASVQNLVNHEARLERYQKGKPLYAIGLFSDRYLRIPEEMQTCAENLKRIYSAIQQYEKDNGKLPDWLSDLVPTYLSNEVLFCPNDPNHRAQSYPDPNLPCSYSWQFSAKPIPSGWDPTGETLCRDWKPHQRTIFGDIVPMVRCNHHGQWLNVACDGQIWWSPQGWEYMIKPNYRFSPDEIRRGN